MSTQTWEYKQLTQGQRYQIEALLRTECMQKEIAVSVGISESTLSRELSRNANDDGCGAESAHALASQRRVTATKFRKQINDTRP
ncbi:MAG: helix-turn-helix domain-containing protein [Candidatus Endonucleobacter sp. (ex Gigantidas childressi)]|nr:helix-turn-helix domain-containing protein [Candidatus Endonucleobacter sp. (ex Gigantidas childressi)]